jgi:hypothetical protein
LNGSIPSQGLHYKAENGGDEQPHFLAKRTCSKKPHLHAGVKYDKIPAGSAITGELGLGSIGQGWQSVPSGQPETA